MKTLFLSDDVETYGSGFKRVYDECKINDVKTAVSEAVTNAIIHGYGFVCSEDGVKNKVRMHCSSSGKKIVVSVEDMGIGIEDVEKAMEPLYTTKPELERSGMGFAFMEAFMDDVQVYSVPGEGTRIVMEKTLGKEIEDV